MYIQDKLEEYADDIFNRLSNGGHIYFCGLKVRLDNISFFFFFSRRLFRNRRELILKVSESANKIK